MRRSSIVAALALLSSGTLAIERPPLQRTQARDHAECFCRAKGQTFAVGESICLSTSEGPRMAQCGMVLNNTSWRFTERPCPESE